MSYKTETLSKQDFNRLKQALYHSKNSLERAARVCPDVKELWLELEKGHRLRLVDVLQWIEAVRSVCWKYGPREIQQRKIKEIELSQPRG
jgi:hypothetical protein